jgi:hypothetical protein
MNHENSRNALFESKDGAGVIHQHGVARPAISSAIIEDLLHPNLLPFFRRPRRLRPRCSHPCTQRRRQQHARNKGHSQSSFCAL